MVDIYSVSLADILPENLKADPQVQALTEAITPELQVIAQAINECLLLPRLDELLEDIVDLLAWQYHVDFYDSSLPLEKKRELVKQANTTHRYKGTPWAIDKVVSTAFDEAVVSEWFEYGGEPGYFKVTTTDHMTGVSKLADIIRAINSVKNIRSHLESISIRRDSSSEVYVGGVVSTLKILTIPAAEGG